MNYFICKFLLIAIYNISSTDTEWMGYGTLLFVNSKVALIFAYALNTCMRANKWCIYVGEKQTFRLLDKGTIVCATEIW
jgi:hypothetical protein